jgi:UDP-N-acetylglucosamine 2-epimerase (non-hydrolysing)
MSKICFVLGTRPEIIKIYPLILECKNRKVDYFLIHTNQHYDPSIDSVFFEELDIETPKYNLNVGSGTHGQMTAKMLVGIETILLDEKPSWVVVQGDTNSTMSGALAGSKIGIKIAHVEAGLRSYDRDMPEEVNRIVTDHIADLLFTPTAKQYAILELEGIEQDKIHNVGNTIVDSVLACKHLVAQKSGILVTHELVDQKYFLLTCHRPSNTDNIECFTSILGAINKLCEDNGAICIFPAHPRLRSKHDLIVKYPNIKVIEPTGFLDLLNLQINSTMIFTDSGGIQEESCILHKKALVLRTNTERPETIEVGGAELLYEVNEQNIIDTYYKLINKEVSWYNPFGDGTASEKIIGLLE